MFWLRQARDKITTLYLEKIARKDNHVPGELIEVVVTGTPSDASSTEGIDAYKLTLGSNVEFLSVLGNKQVTTAMIVDTTANTQVRARVVDYQEVENIRQMEFTEPTEDNPICYLREDDVFFEGIAASSSATVWGVKAYVQSSVVIADMTTVAATIEDIIEEATMTGIKELRPELYDTINDGKQE